MKISAVILARNEEKNIQKAIESLRFCNEIIVIDDDSTDKTKEIAERYGAVVKKRSIQGDFAGQRNYAMTQASYEWILFLDADEEITPELQKSCVDTLRVTKNETYYVKRRDFWWGRELKFGETQKVRNNGIIRLVKKNSGKWMRNVHEEFQVKSKKLKVKSLKGYINHFPHPTVKDFLQDINNYSTLRAKELYNQGAKTNIVQIMLYPFFKFILNYFIYLGFLDGSPGFAYAFFMSFHSFLVRAKLYQYSKLEADKRG